MLELIILGAIAYLIYRFFGTESPQVLAKAKELESVRFLDYNPADPDSDLNDHEELAGNFDEGNWIGDDYPYDEECECGCLMEASFDNLHDEWEEPEDTDPLDSVSMDNSHVEFLADLYEEDEFNSYPGSGIRTLFGEPFDFTNMQFVADQEQEKEDDYWFDVQDRMLSGEKFSPSMNTR